VYVVVEKKPRMYEEVTLEADGSASVDPDHNDANHHTLPENVQGTCYEESTPRQCSMYMYMLYRTHLRTMYKVHVV